MWDARARNGTREPRLDPIAQWTPDRRMDSRPQDGPESGGRTRERRMGSRAQDGPENGGWTRERVMDSRERGWTSTQMLPTLFSEIKKNRYEKKNRYD